MTMDVGVLVRLGDKLTGPLRSVVSKVTASSRQMTEGLARTTAGLKTVGKGLGGIAHQMRGVVAGLAAYSGTMAGLALSFVGPAAQMERFKVQLTSLEGSSAGAEKALAWISDFATRTPLEMTDTIAAYAKLKAFGIDPTNGSLQALVDTMAATGGGVDQLDGLVMALGQSWSKGKLQSEEALQLLERGVPVWDLLAAKLGKTSAEVQAMATAGKLGRDEITLLMQAIGEKNAGASEGMSKTWDGVVSNLMDHWTRFQLMVMNSGVFESLKAKLQSFLDLLNAMVADGRLQAWADTVATNMLAAIEGLWSFGKALVTVWQEVFPWIEAGANALGGWENFLKIIAAGALAGKIMSIGKSVMIVGRGLMMLGGSALMAMPIIGLIAGIALAAYTIYQNWDGIAAWFSTLWSTVSNAASAAWDWIKGAARGAVDWVVGAWNGAKTLLSDAFSAIGSALTGVWTNTIKPVLDKLGVTSAITAAWETLKAAFDTIVNAIGSLFSAIWTNAVKPLIDGLLSVTGVGAAWEAMKEAMAAVMDWLGAKFDWLWQKISPVIDALRWVRDKGAAALEGLGLTGGDAGPGAMPATDGMGNVQGYAKGGAFRRGPIIVGENGPELRYENRGGFIAHHRALKDMARLSARAGSAARGLVDPTLLAGARGGKSLSFAPSYAITINAAQGATGDIEAALTRAIAAHEARARADQRRLLND